MFSFKVITAYKNREQFDFHNIISKIIRKKPRRTIFFPIFELPISLELSALRLRSLRPLEGSKGRFLEYKHKHIQYA